MGPEGPPEGCPEGTVCTPAGPGCDGWCEGGFEIFMIAITVIFGIPILLCCCFCYYRKKKDQQLQQIMERQERV